MANPVIVSQTGVGRSTVVAPDWRVNPFAVSIYVVVNGTVTYTVQDTPDDFPNVVPTNWFNHPTLAALTANGSGNYAFPTRGISVNVTAGTGTATLYVIQGVGIF